MECISYMLSQEMLRAFPKTWGQAGIFDAHPVVLLQQLAFLVTRQSAVPPSSPPSQFWAVGKRLC